MQRGFDGNYEAFMHFLPLPIQNFTDRKQIENTVISVNYVTGSQYLVRVRLLRVVDDENLDRALACLELQTELLLYRSEQ